MLLILAVLLAFFFIPWPWGILVVLAGLIAEAGEVVWGLRLAKRWRPKTGAEAMIGKTAVVVEPCRPTGRVRVDGELWNARCSAGADPGEAVRIEAVEELALVVVPHASDDQPGPPSAEEIRR